ncbi:hypothetical protein [Streptomyces sp. 4F14]|uniref:hypothetical protein n=1 Tax=Streptomyces sp. 4F14 TaxID=3394380 RepID=UPI003A836FD5
MKQHTVFALRLFTEPAEAPAPAPAPGEHFSTDRQVTVLADGTPRAATAYSQSRTSGGISTASEAELMDVIPAPAGIRSLLW